MYSDFNISSSSNLFPTSTSSQFIGTSGAYSVKGTASFTAISAEVGESLCAQNNTIGGSTQKMNPRAYAGRPDRPPVGQEAPLGDLLLPLMLMAAGYLFVKLVRNRKKSQAL